MKGKIFIAWSGTNTLACQVGQRLEQEEYTAIVGGGGAGMSTSDFFVGASVLKQIDQCNQAIFIVQKKDDDTISSNLMFELGYSLARFNSKKIHVFYIDIDQHDPTIPSDINGIWADYFSTQKNPDVPGDIVKKFMANQRVVIPENKMTVIDSYYAQKEKIKQYPTAPYCSEYELAQYVLFFAQAAYMFGDEDEGVLVLRKLMNDLKDLHPSVELSQAVQFGIYYLEVFTKWQKTGDVLFLERADYDSIRNNLNGILKVVESWKQNDFSHWFQVLLYDTINYILILCSYSPNVSEASSKKMLTASIKYAEKCLGFCDLLAGSHLNEQCVQLYRAYMYRNRATVYLRTGGSDTDIYLNLNMSFEERRKLLNYCRIYDINTKLRETFEMEYYLALAELLGYLKEELKEAFNGYREECRLYIQKVRENNRERTYFIQKIEQHIESVKDLEVEEEF